MSEAIHAAAHPGRGKQDAEQEADAAEGAEAEDVVPEGDTKTEAAGKDGDA